MEEDFNKYMVDLTNEMNKFDIPAREELKVAYLVFKELRKLNNNMEVIVSKITR